jgi:hypothetical protein
LVAQRSTPGDGPAVTCREILLVTVDVIGPRQIPVTSEWQMILNHHTHEIIKPGDAKIHPSAVLVGR